MGIIYLVRCLVNNKVYIGQCKRKTRRHKQSMEPKKALRKRWLEHCQGNSGCIGLHPAILKYGPENFTQEVLVVLPDELLNEYEIKFIELYQSTTRKFGYNRATGGNYSGFTMPEVRNKQKLPDSNWHKAQKNPDVSARKQQSLAKAIEKNPEIETRRKANVKAAVQSVEYRKRARDIHSVAQNRPETVAKRRATWDAKREALINSLPEHKRAEKRRQLENVDKTKAERKEKAKMKHDAAMDAKIAAMERQA